MNSVLKIAMFAAGALIFTAAAASAEIVAMTTATAGMSDIISTIRQTCASTSTQTTGDGAGMSAIAGASTSAGCTGAAMFGST